MKVAVHRAITCGNWVGVVISGGIARRAGDNIASAAPKAKAIANIGSRLVASAML